MIPQIRPQQLKAKLDAGEPVYLLDVRNHDERAYCSIAPSEFIPLPELPHRLDEVEPPPGALVVVYCHHGVRSLSGAAILQQAGHANAASLAGGIEAWSLLVDPAVPRY
jgi:rhodanese-related sulfurtransferase